ncbi:peptidoglycan DD-metalloendopeptidase family protein [Promicromonospora aerolata]|uniref:Peptidoglycan DD-metalloendopeptidase family protein n=1 Tax=Promicromonospora aerolata TaxID=195749 RepID=A0ABW4V5J7_9MICO
MTSRASHAHDQVLGRSRIAILIALLAVALVALPATVPAAAMRSGPDVAIRAGVDIGPGSRWTGSSPGGSGSGGSGSGGSDSGGDVGADARAGSTGYVPPVAGVDPPSGVERGFDPPEEIWGAGHRGVDLTAPRGSSVLSPGPGIVTFAGQVARRGVVVVTHPDGLRTSLEPVAATVPVGTAVAAGTAIGVVEGGDVEAVGVGGGSGGDGSSDGGRSGGTGGGDGSDHDGSGHEREGGGTTASHCAPRSCLHWGVRRGERYIDPLSLLYRPPIVLLPDH